MTESPSSLDNLTASDNTPYARGSKTARVKTARVARGARLLTAGVTGRVVPAYRKTEAVVRVVERVSWGYVANGGRRAQRSYEIWFTDGTLAVDLAPIQAWDALVLDTASSASRQHFIDTGWYLTEAEVGEYA